MNHRRAHTLIELIVVLSLGAFIAFVTALALGNTMKIFNNTSGRDTAIRELSKAKRSLEVDLSQASASRNISPAPASLGGGADGDAINYLSAVYATDGTIATLQDGSGNPYFFQNIFYYITVPADHNSLFGSNCVGGNEGGYDYNCPHKILIRGVEDQNPAFDPSDSGSVDLLLSPLAPFLTRPTGFPKSPARDTVAINLLTFQVTPVGGELRVDLRAVSIADARRKVSIGTYSFRETGFTLQYRFSVFPRN